MVSEEGKIKLRLFAFFLFSLSVYPLESWKVLLFLLVFALLLFPLFGVSYRYLKGALLGNLFLLFVVISLLLLDLKGNWQSALVIFLKANIIFSLTALLVLPLRVWDIAKALSSLGVPKNLTAMLLLSYRYIYSLQREWEKMKRAAYCRGFEPKTDLRTYRTYGYLLGNLTLKSYLKAKEVYKAMVCRGF